ncbi:hypothetical protein R1sor_026692 [Riccia sorocarpa]|uniref:RNA helicase n=1 Tax=Riccia sorocarpa TaxID=122646 RepID=A0ABD3GHV0_9MARC
MAVLKAGRPAQKHSLSPGNLEVFRPPGSLNSVDAFVSGQDIEVQEDKSGKVAEAVIVLRKRCRLHVSGQNVPPPLMSFEDLRSKNIDASGYTEPTPIQRQAIPTLLAVPCDAGIRAVIVCPIRELATQTARECRKIAEGRKMAHKGSHSYLILDEADKLFEMGFVKQIDSSWMFHSAGQLGGACSTIMVDPVGTIVGEDI